ncbi:MAG: four helix bundle protein [Bacteroidia bacterium]
MKNIEFVEAFKQRTKTFALRTIKLFHSLPKTDEARIIGKQLLRSSTSVAANYRAACRARSEAEFHSKISIVVEEADESAFWMELIIEADIMKKERVDSLLKEANEILAVMSKARSTTSKKIYSKKKVAD